MQYIVIKESYGWVVKEYNNEVPEDKQFKIFNSKEDADNFIDNQEF